MIRNPCTIIVSIANKDLWIISSKHIKIVSFSFKIISFDPDIKLKQFSWCIITFSFYFYFFYYFYVDSWFHSFCETNHFFLIELFLISVFLCISLYFFLFFLMLMVMVSIQIMMIQPDRNVQWYLNLLVLVFFDHYLMMLEMQWYHIHIDVLNSCDGIIRAVILHQCIIILFILLLVFLFFVVDNIDYFNK